MPKFDYIDTTVKGGFPVRFWFDIKPPEPDVGLTEQYIDDCYFTTRDGRACDWLKISDTDMSRVYSEAFDSYNQDRH